MKNYLLFMIVGLCVFAGGCNRQGVPVEYANMCDIANNGKTIEVVGFLANDGSAMCSSSAGGGPIKCGIRFKDSLSSEKWVFANITKGTWSSEIENVEGKGLKIRDNNSEFIEKEQKVKVTASVLVFTPPSGDPKTSCSLSINRIEKTQ